MRLFLKVFGIAVVLAGLFLAGFALWGEQFEGLFSQERCVQWFTRIRPVAWLAAMGLLLADLLLPVPATGIMAALGAIYGVWLGATIGAAGSALAGLTGYSLARLAGKRGIRFIASDQEIARFGALAEQWGGVGIIISRAMPILPEVLSVLAGLAQMSFRRFLPALLLGTIPTAILFAYIGHAAADQPTYGVALAIVIPLLIWPVFLRFARSARSPAPTPDTKCQGRRGDTCDDGSSTPPRQQH